MLENIRLVYSYYGSLWNFFSSGYFLTSIFFTILSFKSFATQQWAELAVGIMPTLAGFMVAASSFFFSLLSPKDRDLLLPIDDSGSAPLLEVLSTIVHAIVMQVTALLLGMIFLSNTIIESFHTCVVSSLSALGVFFTYYGVFLMLGAALSVFRVQFILATARKLPAKSSDSSPESRVGTAEEKKL